MEKLRKGTKIKDWHTDKVIYRVDEQWYYITFTFLQCIYFYVARPTNQLYKIADKSKESFEKRMRPYLKKQPRNSRSYI